MAERKLVTAADSSKREAVGLRMKIEEQNQLINQQKDKIKTLEGHLAITKQELRILGKRPAPDEYDDPSKIIDGVNEALQQRKSLR